MHSQTQKEINDAYSIFEDAELVMKYPGGEYASKEIQKSYVLEKEPQQKSVIDKTSIEMIFIIGGRFNMGSNKENDEKPIHNVFLNDFYISKYEVTQKQWRDVMHNNPSSFSGCDNCPVEQVSWNDVQEFIEKLNRKTGKNFRLPTEAEWEYAAKGGAKSSGYKYSGSNSLSNIGWYRDNSGRKTHSVGKKNANELGIFDMSGNVWEWCSDVYDNNYYANTSHINPQGLSSGSYRVGRGGGWGSGNNLSRVANRRHWDSSYSSSFVGFRLVLPSSSQKNIIPEHIKQKLDISEEEVPQKSVINQTGIEMILVIGGTYYMGSNEENDEKPIHNVFVDDFYISKYEVTQKQWREVMDNNPSYFTGCDNCPVESVSWEETQKFIKRLNQKRGKHFRLPTEAEWEYAAKGGAKNSGYKYSGSNSLSNIGWYKDNSGWRTHPVGKKHANELGIFDMSGNVWEWCYDTYDNNYYGTSSDINPINYSVGDYNKVGRGGGLVSENDLSRVTNRHFWHSTCSSSFIGFRLVLPSSSQKNLPPYMIIPRLSPNSKLIAYIDGAGFEETSNLEIYNFDTKQSRYLTNFKPRQDMSVRSVIWLNDNNLLLIIGHTYGTLYLGGNLYRYNLTLKKLTLIESSDFWEFSDIKIADGKVYVTKTRWVDINDDTDEKETQLEEKSINYFLR